MKAEDVSRIIEEHECLIPTGHDDAVIGVAVLGGCVVAVVSANKMIRTFMERDEMSEDEAWEYFLYNVEGGYHGPNTPVFVNDNWGRV